MSHYQCSCGANVFGTGADHICTNAPRTVTGDNQPGNTVTIPYAEYQRLKALDVPAVQPVMAGTDDHDEAVRLLGLVFDAWENGDSCTEDGEPDGAYMGQCFQLDTETFDACCNLLNRLNPPRNVAPVAPVTEREGGKWVPIKPTLDMYNAACKAFCAWEVQCDEEERANPDSHVPFSQPMFTHSDVYAAMLAAAP